MNKNNKIFIATEKNISSAALIEYFRSNGFTNVLSDYTCKIDLLDQNSVCSFLERLKPEYVFLTHLNHGSIVANIKYPADFIYNNLQIQNNIIHCSYKFDVKKLLFFGSSCGYPRECAQPMKEEYLFSGKLEETSEPYAIAKLTGIKMCQSYRKQYGANFISIIPATIYGPGDDFDLEKGHVIPSLIKRFHEAKVNNEKEVIVWGTGKPRREFIYVNDMVDACIFLMYNYDILEIINIGSGEDVSIKELAQLIKDIIEFKGDIIFDESKPDGVPQKLLDSSKIKSLGWKANVKLEEGLRRTYEWYKKGIK